MTKEQIERIAANCGVVVSYAEEGKGGFIVDSTNIKYESLTDVVNRLVVIDSKKTKQFLDEFNKNKVTSDFLLSCEKAAKYFGMNK